MKSYFYCIRHCVKIKILLFVNRVVTRNSRYILAVSYPDTIIYRAFYPNILEKTCVDKRKGKWISESEGPSN